MASKLVFDRGKDSESVASIGEAQMGVLLKAVPAGPARKALEVVVTALFAELRAREKDLRDADEAHERELGDDDAARLKRDEINAALREKLLELRSVLTALYGAAVARQVGFERETPQDPEPVERLAGEVEGTLGTIKLPKARLGVTKIDRASALAVVASLRKQLRASLKDVAREGREAKVTLAAKNRAIDAFDRTLRGVAGFIESCFVLAGEDELASSVRPSRGGGSSVEETEDDSDENSDPKKEPEAEKPAAPKK